MAPKKKTVRRKNNKKKNTGINTAIHDSSGNAQDNHRRSTTANDKKFWKANTDDECDDGEVASAIGGGIYATYKQATQRFKEGLLALVPMEMLLARSNHRDTTIRVQTIMDAVDVLVRRKETIPSTLLEDCRVSLHFRKRHAKSFVDGGDEGHSYFILVLQYCVQSLQQLVVRPRATNTTKQKRSRKSSQQSQAFRFTDLELDDESDNDEDERNDSAATLIRPPAPEKDYTMDDLVDSTDRCQAILFFTHVDKCMGAVAQQYAAIRQMAVQQLCLNPPAGLDDDEAASPFIGPLMTAAAVTNFCIRHVQRMEAEIKLDVPHFTTIYRIMASCMLKMEIDGLDQYVKRIGKRVPRSELTAFVGDLVEQGFRLCDDEDDDDFFLTMSDRITMEFCETWDLPYDDMETLGRQSLERTLHETGMAEAAHDSLVPHQWTFHYQYIGSGRSILNTLSRLQKVAKWFPVISAPKTFYGVLWEEQNCLAKRIQGDMDQLLMESILLALLFICSNGPLSFDGVPWLNQLLPFVKDLRQFVDNPKTPASLSLAFGVHAVLTSILELQGDNVVASIARAAENAHRTFYDQRDEWSLRSKRFRGVGNLPYHHQNLELYKDIPTSIDLKATGVDDTKSKKMREQGFWNPFCAGMFLHNFSQGINMRSVVFVNVHSQLRIALHLYNAFQLRDLLKEEIPLLTSLDTYFGALPKIWGSEKATRETILTKYWIAGGWKAEIIRAFHKDCCRFVFGEETSDEMTFQFRDGRVNRRAYEQACRPGDVSKTFRRICKEDFHGMLSEREETCVEDWEWYMQFVNEIVENMTREEELFSWNLVTLGDCIEDLLFYLADKLGWQEMLDEVVASLVPTDEIDSAWAKRSTIIKRLVHQVLGPLELIDAVESDPVVVAVRDHFVEYFQTLEPSKYKFFKTMKD